MKRAVLRALKALGRLSVTKMGLGVSISGGRSLKAERGWRLTEPHAGLGRRDEDVLVGLHGGVADKAGKWRGCEARGQWP